MSWAISGEDGLACSRTARRPVWLEWRVWERRRRLEGENGARSWRALEAIVRTVCNGDPLENSHRGM